MLILNIIANPNRKDIPYEKQGNTNRKNMKFLFSIKFGKELTT